MLEDSLGYTDGKEIGSNKGIKLRYSLGKVLGTVFRIVDGITLGIDARTDLGRLYRSFDDSNGDIIEAYLFEAHWDLLMIKFLTLMKSSYWDDLMVNYLALYSEMWMQYLFGLLLKQIWDL